MSDTPYHVRSLTKINGLFRTATFIIIIIPLYYIDELQVLELYFVFQKTL